MDYVRENIARVRNVEEIAAAVRKNPDYLSRLFRRETRLSCGEYLRRCRMERAREVLFDVTLSVKEVAGAVGYPKLKHFSDAFHRYWGMSPTAMRSGRLD